MNFDSQNAAQPISAVDAIVPAFRRLRSILAGPFRLGLFLKICLVVALTESGFVSAMFSYPIQGANAVAHGGLHPANTFLADGFAGLGAIGAGVILLLLAAALVGVALWIVSVYLFCRLRLTVLDLAIYREGRIRRAWQKYGRQSWRYFGLTILVGLAFLLIVGAVVGPFIPALIRMARSMDVSNPNPFAMLGLILPLFAAFLLLSLLGMVVDAVIRDFLLPPMVVEDAPLESALHRFLSLVRGELGSVTLYLFMRFLISFALTAALGILCILPVVLLALLAFAVGVPLYHSLWTGGTQIVFIAYVVATATVVLILYLLGLMTMFGVNGVFKLCYSITFFSSRYEALRRLVEPASQQADLGEIPPVTLPTPGIFPATEPPSIW